MAQKRKHSNETSEKPSLEPTIYRSAPIEDRDSTFIGLYSPDLSPKELQKLPELKSASHCMLAWRRESNQQSLTSTRQYVTGHDDDGEKYGGKKVEHVLVNMKAIGVCVVARWYGGTMLGQVRFAHIENCASEAVRQWSNHIGEQQAKKRRIEEEVVEKGKLVQALAKRDQSINVLRTLAAEKEKLAKDAAEGMDSADGAVNGQAIVVDATRDTVPPPPRPEPSSQTGIDYDAMTVERLRALDKARDATLAFLLKRIDKAESALSKAANAREEGRKSQPPLLILAVSDLEPIKQDAEIAVGGIQCSADAQNGQHGKEAPIWSILSHEESRSSAVSAFSVTFALLHQTTNDIAYPFLCDIAMIDPPAQPSHSEILRRIDALEEKLERRISSLETRMEQRMNSLGSRVTDLDVRLNLVNRRTSDLDERIVRSDGRITKCDDLISNIKAQTTKALDDSEKRLGKIEDRLDNVGAHREKSLAKTQKDLKSTLGLL